MGLRGTQLTGSIIYTLVTLRVAVCDILDLFFFLPVAFLGLNPWRFTTLRRFCNPSSDGWRLFSRPNTRNRCDKDHIAYLLLKDPSTFVSPFPYCLLVETLRFRDLPRSFHRIPRLSDFVFHGCRRCDTIAFVCW
jgi:hypothetical protein